MTDKSYRLDEIAKALGAELRGDPDAVISGLATLQAAVTGQISFLANPSYAKYLAETHASAVIVSPAEADKCSTNVLLLANPYLGYAQLSHWFSPEPVRPPGQHATAIVDPSASISPSASIGPNVVIEAGVDIGERVIVGAGSVIGARTRIGAGTVIHPRVTLAHDVVVGQRCHILSGAVIGSDGFGFANEKGV
ncbi:MAG TPA: UDP-3-O-(3-hydroxymyristoyl)glucosamine N-acyltransferase, partial [Marinobacter sp.]|nr:UDP-3-O-(3-hydroxymyristoyl)glucosamine N-acyltransferase [Marinobacter sp.]